MANRPKAAPTERTLRAAIVAKARWMNASGINQGTSGNISARCGGKMLITPSAQPYDKMTPAMIAAMPLDEREILLAVALAQLSYEAAARILDVPYATAVSRLMRARARLDATRTDPTHRVAHLRLVK